MNLPTKEEFAQMSEEEQYRMLYRWVKAQLEEDHEFRDLEIVREVYSHPELFSVGIPPMPSESARLLNEVEQFRIGIS